MPLTVGISTFGCDGGRSGIGQYAIQMLRQFPVLEPQARFEACVLESEREVFTPAGSPLTPLCFPNRLGSPVVNLAWHTARLPHWCKARRFDVLFLPAGNRRAPVWAPCPAVGTVHDFSSIHLKGKYDPLRMVFITRVVPFLARRLTHIITVSESSKRDIVEFARIPAEHITVIPQAADTSLYYPRDTEQCQALVAARYGVRPPYLLYISRIEHPGKNHARLIRAFARAAGKGQVPHTLVLAGSDWTRAEEVHRAAAESGVADRIVFTGFAPVADLPALYGGADLFVFPSLYEGFGIPVLEAMCCGVPVLCSNLSSLPEVAGDAAVLADPTDEEALGAAILDLLADPGKRARYAARGLEHSRAFSWRATASRTLEVLRMAAGQPARQTR